MIRKWIHILLLSLMVFSAEMTIAQQRFPKPEFETGYEQPAAITPAADSLFMQYLDIFLLILVMSLATRFALKTRSRKGILILSIFTLLYFGFFRNGCICSIGSIQNVVTSISDSSYILPLSTLAFFILPLLFTLFFGRVFCSSACPLGVMQDLVNIKPIKLNPALQKVLSIFPYLYLGLAILYAWTGTDYIICRFDPFIGIYRLNGPFLMILLGIIFLILSLFIGRPYCRFVCPYGVLLNWTSRFSRSHLSISASQCINCNLCESSCPFDAIVYPNEKKAINEEKNRKRFILAVAMIPVWMFLFGLAFSESHYFLAKLDQDVYLADMISKNPEVLSNTDDIDIKTFVESGQTIDELKLKAKDIVSEFYAGSWILGLFIGLVIGIKIAREFMFKRKEIYEPDKGQCFSCARCIDFCPVKE